MCNIETFVFFDIETTGLPWQERNRTKITELCFVAALKKDIMNTKYGELPPVSKLSLVFNPKKTIHPEAVKITGLSNELLLYAPTFEKRIGTIVSFLLELPRPVCLVAHNGDRFDYKIILAEFNDAKSALPSDIVCIDSLIGFKHILKGTKPNTAVEIDNVKPPVSSTTNFDISIDDLLTDDEDEWPDFDVSKEDWEDIDKTCVSLSDMSCENMTELQLKEKNVTKRKNSEEIKKVFLKEKKANIGYSLVSLYKQIMNKDACNSHRAEGDCLMLLECVVAMKNQFIPWADKSYKKITEMKPLIRH